MASIVQNLVGGSLTDGVAKIISLFKIPPSQVEEHKFEISEIQLEMQQKALEAATAQAKAQTDIDLAEAQHGGFSDWRVGVGWTCALALFYQMLFRPLATWVVALAGKTMIPPPALDMGTLVSILFAMLGIGVHYSLTDGRDNANGKS